MNYYEIQQIAKETINYIIDNIRSGMSVIQLKELAELYMKGKGIPSFWYYNVGAFIFAGEDTILSISGRNYYPSSRVIKNNDIVTVDLSPQFDHVWGDYSRTIIIENGKVAKKINDMECEEFRDGLICEDKLHDKLREIATPDMTFEEVYIIMNSYILDLGYENLDFLGNLGHSIEKDKDSRIYIEKCNVSKLNSVKMFTFEPHIRKINSKFGFKKENIYYFKDDILVDL